ncbi:hypothetical protein [Methanofollis fontis]|uniref:Uncharacterized protein n=1 Tax=Methanofollis fontis TaxID=2052832 RepID=A0A483CV89_9EURY|nr:hypothetical protein [Methanofollis fontis]TAJ45397.1 hypothetical protein CUJ86_01250 [Methanofollis fontis]
MIDMLDYETSPLNPLLKVIVPLIFLAVTGIYFAARRHYDGAIRSFIDMLMLFALFATISGVLRFLGHGTDFGFTKDYSLKWIQSLAYVFEAGFFILAGYKLLHLFGGDDE